jgi:hypothetical protein
MTLLFRVELSLALHGKGLENSAIMKVSTATSITTIEISLEHHFNEDTCLRYNVYDQFS